jgi:2-polyprenyl-3-methyl-5-hydroxy-6-metoxy-1,4-benzoquinol methylase
LSEEQIRDRLALRQLVDEIAADGGTYHQLNLRPDLSVLGDYDMRRYVDAFHIPDDLTGLTVLDVGTAAGYFALECARRGGDVIAMDLWETTPVGQITKSVDVRIRYVQKNIYDLDPSFGQFDLVICGSLLLHLPDVLGAVAALRKVCRGRLCVSTACPDDSGQSPRPICDFVAAQADDGNYYTYWLTSEAALRQMLLVAGFSRVANQDHFVLTSNEGRHPYATRHVVMSAFVE